MSEWTLPQLLAGLHEDIHTRLATVRKAIAHPTAKGDASERVWLDLLKKYLPKRYHAEKAFVVDSNGRFSQQIDVLIFDQQYSPFIFHYEGEIVVPAESVYAAFEAKQAANATQIAYAREKIASVRQLYRTSLPIPSASGELPAKKPQHIVGGLVTFESDWNPALGEPLRTALDAGKTDDKLDLGCIASAGLFRRLPDSGYEFLPEGRPATAFLFELIARLQVSATVGMIDVRAYSRWLAT